MNRARPAKSPVYIDRTAVRPAISFIIPALNEARNIGYVLEGINKVMSQIDVPYEMLVIDDGSRDRTTDVARHCGANVFSYKVTRGKGFALRQGFLNAKGTFIVMIDSDGEHRPKEIPRFLDALCTNGVDIINGSRYLGQYASENRVSWTRYSGNRLINMLISILIIRQVTDALSGYKAFKRDILHEITLDSDGFGIEGEMTIKLLQKGFRMKEIPITNFPRTHLSNLRALRDGVNILITILKYSCFKRLRKNSLAGRVQKRSRK
jgi:glycosyltransferase involved in cell wall biosynthesis